MASKWGERLLSKFTSLTESSSKESVLTLANWIYFNRKHKEAFVEAFRDCIHKKQSMDEKRSVASILLSVLNEIFLMHHGTDKWNGAEDLRRSLGDSLVLHYALLFPPAKLESCLEHWEKAFVFGGPMLIRQIRQIMSLPPSAEQPFAVALSGSSSPKAASPTGGDVPVAEPAEEPEESVVVENKTDEVSQPPQRNSPPISVDDQDSVSSDPVIIPKPIDPILIVKEPLTLSLDTSSSNNKDLIYDFEAKGIPAAFVDPKEFIEPCRLIATLQIARDLRSDSAVQLSSLLQGLPESVRAFIAEAAENDGLYELTDERAREFCEIVNEQLLDIDMAEQLQNVITFLDIVRRQRVARQQILELIIASRCQFGANDAAAAYFAVNDNVLKQRAQILADAMDLEGLEVQQVAVSAMAALEADLPPLSWYSPLSESAGATTDDSNKRQKVDDT
jgi:hypothetical protein